MRQKIAAALMTATLLLQSVPTFFASSTQTQQPMKHAPTAGRQLPIREQATEGGLWRTDGGFQTTVMIGNMVELQPITVTPVLYMADGTEFDLAPVQLAPAGVATINVNNALRNAPASLASHISTYGSVGIHYQWSWNPAVATSVRIFDDVRSLVYIPHLAGDVLKIQDSAAPQAQQVLEGMWWKALPDMGGFLSLTNRSLTPIAATLSVFDSGAANTVNQAITLPPHSTQLFDLAPLWNQLPHVSAQGGIRMSYTGPRDALVPYGGLEYDAKGYSHELRFTSSTVAAVSATESPLPQTVTLAAAGIMIGAQEADMHFPANTRFQPYLVLRNTTPQVLQVQLAGQAGNSPMVALGNVSLSPLGVQQVDLQTLLQAIRLSSYNGMLNIAASYQGQPGDLLEATGSVDQTLNYVFEVPARREAWSQSRILNYWNTAGDNDTMATLWNYTNKDQDLVLILFHEHGKYKLPIHLAAHASTTISFASLIRKGIPDPEGNVIPTNIVQGRAKLSGAKANSDKIDVSLSVSGYNVRTGTCGCYSYWCDGISNWWMDGANINVGQVVGLNPTVQFYSGGTEVDNSAFDFGSSDSSVAGVDSYGNVAGYSPGTVGINAVSGQLWAMAEYGCGCDPEGTCSYSNIGYGASVTVYDTTPLITGMDPSDWSAGATTQVTISGQYFGTNAPTLSFSPSAGISYSLPSYNDTQIVASVTVSAGTPNEQVAVSVTNNGYGGSSFNGGGGGQSARSASVNATIHSPINSAEITVIAWVNGQAPDLNPLPGGANQNLVTNLNSSPNTCGAEIFAWAVLGSPVDLLNSTDQAYANAWLVKFSANPAPPSTITPSAQLSAGNFRLINDFGGRNGGFYQIGVTPDPCGTSVPTTILNWLGKGQSSQYNGASGTSASGKFYQLAEGRIGTMGQLGSETINGGRTVPWIWSAIEFDSSGNPTYSDVGMFPTYSVYVNGTLSNTYAQSSVASFVAKDQTFQRTPSQIQ